MAFRGAVLVKNATLRYTTGSVCVSYAASPPRNLCAAKLPWSFVPVTLREDDDDSVLGRALDKDKTVRVAASPTSSS